MMFSSRSVHATSSTSTFFDVEGEEAEGSGRIYSLKVCSVAALANTEKSDITQKNLYAIMTLT